MRGWADPQREILVVESVAGHLLAEGGVFAFLAAYRRELFPGDMFADLFASGRGRPSIPADVIVAAIVMQMLRGLSDEVATPGHGHLADRRDPPGGPRGARRRRRGRRALPRPRLCPAGQAPIAWDDLDARELLVDALVGDAHRLLGHLLDQELEAKAAEAVVL